jgi:hypothetical protein
VFRGLRSPRRIGLVALSVLVLCASVATYRNRPLVLVGAALTPLILALMRPARQRPSASTLFIALVFALIALISYRDGNLAWHAIQLYVPGASALRAISRFGILLLIPWAIGLAYFVEAMVARRRPVSALAVTLICLVEQGVTTPSYDKDKYRSLVAAIERRIDRRDLAFYYSPHDADAVKAPEVSNLDAMWASLESGVPTINGYSGNFPPGWYPLFDSNIQDECHVLCLEASLRHWASAHGLPLERVGWIGKPERWQARTASFDGPFSRPSSFDQAGPCQPSLSASR